MIEFLLDLDKSLFLLINGNNHPVLDSFMYIISDKYFWIPLYGYLMYVIIERFRMKSLYLIVFTILLIALSDQLSVHLFKNLVQRLRPCHEPSLAPYVHLVNDYCGGSYGFISSHSSNSFALAVFYGLILGPFSSAWRKFLISWAALVSYSRIYLGAHYPGDVLSGAAFGAILAIALYFILNRLNDRHSLNLMRK
jgi:undecaprenyl-diphosphatase